MEEKDVKKQLSSAKKHRNTGEFAEALAILHQINNDFPHNVTYRYLLASTYYESMNVEAAQKYVEEAIKMDETFKENFELLGNVYEKQGHLDKAIESYKKAFSMDHKYLSVSEKLIQLYLKAGNYQGVLDHCNMIMSYIPIDTSSMKARILTSKYFACVLYKGWALVYLKYYEQAAEEITRRRQLHTETKSPSFPNQYKDDDETLFKLYIKLNDVQKIEEYKDKLVNEYNCTPENLEILKAEADQDIILFRQRPEVMAQLGLS